MPRRAVAAAAGPTLALALALAAGGCASGRSGPPPAGGPAEAATGAPAEAPVEAPVEGPRETTEGSREGRSETPAAAAPAESPLRQGLFRVRFRGVDGRGRIRLTLRSTAAGDFALEAVDTFGRRLWTFESIGGASLLLDHRAAEYCRLEGDVVFRTVALSDLAVSTLPRVLLGELPLPPPADEELQQTGEVEFRSADGRRWTARFDEDRLSTWTLWEDGAPLVWWKREEDGGILSHRDGAQALWKTITVETVEEPLAPLEIPDGYAAADCDGDDLP
jgi:hypothetical protein